MSQRKDRRLGWKKDKYDGRDFLHRPVKAIPDEVDLSKFLAPTRNQEDEGSCTGFGIGGNLSSLAKMLGVYTEWFSPRDIYNGGKFVGGYLTEEGAMPRDCFEWLRSHGALLDSLWPYIANQGSSTAPPSRLDSERAKHPVLEYRRVDNGVDGICGALAEGHFVSIGTPWYEKWMDTDSNGNLAQISINDPVAGGHETFLFGHSRPKKLVFGLNSWNGWGYNQTGIYRMPFDSFEVFKQVGGYDAHYAIVQWGTAPSPTPPPPAGLHLRLQRKNGSWKTLWQL
jgi:hypothetical protein